jgi:hypothetical protein
VRLLRLLKGAKVFYQTVNLIRCLAVRTFRLPHIYTTDSKRASSVQLRIARGQTRAQDTHNFHTEKIMNTRILDMTIPEVPGVFAAAMADPRTTNPLVEQAWRDRLVREAAYFRSQHRRPCHGKELEDWLAAEREVDEALRRSRG